MDLFVFGGMFVTPPAPYVDSTKMLAGSASPAPTQLSILIT